MPAATPVTTPVEELIVAAEVFPLTHVPPVTASASVVVAPGEVASVPVIAAGVAVLTVTGVVTTVVPQVLVTL